MALKLDSVKSTIDSIQGLLGEVSGAAPAVIDAVKGLAAQGVALVQTLKDEFETLVKPANMTDAETKAALDAGSAGLKADMDAVDAAPKTGQA